MASIFFIFNAVLTVCIYIFLLRFWMQLIRVNFYNPFTQFIIRITQPITAPMRRFIPSIGPADTSTILIAYIISLVKISFILYQGLKYPMWDISYFLYGLYTLIYTAGRLVFWLLIIRAILSWITRGQANVDELLYQLTEPLIRPIRKIIPPLGSIDLSFSVVIFILLALNVVATELFGTIWILLSRV